MGSAVTLEVDGTVPARWLGRISPSARRCRSLVHCPSVSSAVLVLCTVSGEAEGRRLARDLVDRRLAACVNMVPAITSIYRWQGEVEEAAECLLLIKSTRDAYVQLRDALIELHSYDVPEVLAVDIAAGSPPYLDWLMAQVAVSEDS